MLNLRELCILSIMRASSIVDGEGKLPIVDTIRKLMWKSWDFVL